MEILKEDFEIKGLSELTEVDVLAYLKETSTKMIKNINIFDNRIFTDNEYFREYVREIKINQKNEIVKFKAIIKDLNRRIDRGDF